MNSKLQTALGLNTWEYKDLLDELLARLSENDMDTIAEVIREKAQGLESELKMDIQDKADELETEFEGKLEAIIKDKLKRVSRPSDYHLIEANRVEDLGELVRGYMKDGWVLQGGLTVTCYDGVFYYNQAMILFE